MSIGEICNREVVIAQFNDSVLFAAQLMRKYHVEEVIVVNKSSGNTLPVGIITESDLVIEILATELDPSTLMIGDIMVSELVTLKESIDVFEAIRYMRTKGVRRMPVVDDSGSLIGVVTLDDLLELLVEELGLLVKLIAYEQKKEALGRT